MKIPANSAIPVMFLTGIAPESLKTGIPTFNPHTDSAHTLKGVLGTGIGYLEGDSRNQDAKSTYPKDTPNPIRKQPRFAPERFRHSHPETSERGQSPTTAKTIQGDSRRQLEASIVL